MVLLTLALGFGCGFGASALIGAFNYGFGRALGEFALILLPSFTLAAALTRRNVASDTAGRTSALVSPVAGAGMICPDTAYAALAPAAGRYKLDMTFGAYAGFKLLYPAGPLIVATGLGLSTQSDVQPSAFLFYGALLTLPVWGAGIAWARFWTCEGANDRSAKPGDGRLVVAFAPFILMASLLTLGGVIGSTGMGPIDFLLLPKGALIAAAILALIQTPAGERRECLDSAVRRTGSLLLVIGAASAFGAVLTGSVPLDRMVQGGNGVLTLIGLFALSAAFKLAQGSSMATFASVAPVAAPVLAISGTDPVAAVFAICLGSFVAILPNDSYYWLVRRDAFDPEKNEGRVIWVLAGGAMLQALLGMVLLLTWGALWK
ncbi:MAG: GntP family permease [Alphaproteobacteria bacterium]|nr:GntP family permease [Alphaproteobacteria bacterium]